MPRLRTAVDYAAYVAVRLVVCLLQALPMATCERAARRVAWFAWHVVRLRRRVIEENLELAFPQASPSQRAAIAVAMWEHLLVMLAEIAQAPRKLHRTNWRDYSRIPELKAMTRHLLDRRPLVILSGHLGNFEMGGYLLGLHGFPTHTIARRLDNRFLDRWINAFRGATGQYILDKAGSGPQIAELLAAGETIVLLGDQHAGAKACWVDFFGRPASTNKAVGLFTLGSEAPTAVAAALRMGRPLSFELAISELVDPRAPGFALRTVPDVAQWYSQQLEALVRRAPEQYWWVHRRWKGAPPQRVRAAA